MLVRQPCLAFRQSAAAWTESSRGSVRGGGLCISRKVDGDQETIRAVVGKLVTVPFEGFVLALPHAEAVVGLGAPVFQVVPDHFLVGIIALDLVHTDLIFAIAHLGMRHTRFGVYSPGERNGLHGLFLPGNCRIELGENLTESGLLLLADGG